MLKPSPSLPYGLPAQLKFYGGYFFSKAVRLWFEVRRPKARLFLYEMIYSAGKVFPPLTGLLSRLKISEVESRFGRFRIRPETQDAACASPAFERADVDRLLRLLRELLDADRPVLFLDIGADFGAYTVTVGNRFADRPGLVQAAFEPSDESFALLRENVAANGLSGRAVLFQAALAEEEGREIAYFFNAGEPGSSGQVDPASPAAQTRRLVARTLDGLLAEAGLTAAGRTVVFKIDVEGFESQVLAGAERTLAEAREVWLLVEDFINPEIIATLRRRGAAFIGKETPYNSWWRLTPRAKD